MACPARCCLLNLLCHIYLSKFYKETGKDVFKAIGTESGPALLDRTFIPGWQEASRVGWISIKLAAGKPGIGHDGDALNAVKTYWA